MLWTLQQSDYVGTVFLMTPFFNLYMQNQEEKIL
jgi:hypothetical protein